MSGGKPVEFSASDNKQSFSSVKVKIHCKRDLTPSPAVATLKKNREKEV